MAATGYTPISLYYSTTASAVPTAGNLANGELALNIADMKLYAKNSAGTVTLLASNAATTPISPLTANGVVYVNGSSLPTSGSALTFDGTNFASTGNITSGGVLQALTTVQSSSGADLSLNANGANRDVIYKVNATELMRLVGSTGNLGIGTSSPVEKIHASAASGYTALRLTNTGSASPDKYITVFQGSSSTGLAAFDESGVVEATSTGGLYLGAYNGPIRFYTGSTSRTERARIDSSGNMLMGTTSTLGYSGLVFNMKSSGSYVGLNASSTEARVFATWDTTVVPMTFYMGGVERARISGNGGWSVGTTADPGAGAIYATGAITAYYSDERLKDVKGRIQNALAKVRRLSGVYYTNNETAKALGYTSDEMQVGVLANQMKGELPEIVKPAPFDLDENGNSKSGQNYMTVQYERGLPLLIEALKELADQFDDYVATH